MLHQMMQKMHLPLHSYFYHQAFEIYDFPGDSENISKSMFIILQATTNFKYMNA